MTLALASIATPPPAAPDPRLLVSSTEAAPLLGCDLGHLRRLCREELARKGLAFFLAPPEGGQARWYVHRDYDPRLIPGPLGQLHREPALDGFTHRQQATARQRRECVAALREARASWPGDVRDWMPRLVGQLRARFPALKLTAPTLYRWDKLYQRPADLPKLIDGRGGNRRGRDSAEAWDAFRDLYLHPNRPAAATCWREVKRLAEANGWRWCNKRSCYAQLDERVPPEVQELHRNPAAWRKQLRPTIAQDPEAWRAGECWVGDHKQLDLWCRWGGTVIRPWLTTWMDWRTRRVCGWVLSDCPNSTTILAALRHGLLDPANMGGPAAVWIDNGRDYDAWLFHGQTKRERRARVKPAVDEGRAAGVFGMLSIDPHFSVPFNPNGKSRQERWFRTLGEFCKLFDTYAGEGVETRPERLNAVLADPRLVPAFEAVRDRLAAHVRGYNANADHARADLSDGGERLSPDAAMARWCRTKRVPADPAALELLLAHWHKPVTVGRNGITINVAGVPLHYGQFDLRLSRFKARRKADRRELRVAYDPHDLRTVRVFDPAAGMDLVGVVEMNQLGGRHGSDPISRAHVAELNRQKAAYAKGLRHDPELSLTSVLTTEERLGELAAARPPAPPPPPPQTPPPSLQIRPTPLDGRAEAVRREELRRAVGESGRPAERRPSVFDRLRGQTPAPRPPAPDRPSWLDVIPAAAQGDTEAPDDR